MNEIIDGMSPYDYPGPGMIPGGSCGPTGCGFGSWIWILLILFYTNNQGAVSNMGCGCGCNNSRSGYGNGCCGNSNLGCTSGAGGYLFLLVILFLSGSFGNNYPIAPYGLGDCGGLGAGYESACDCNN